MVKNHRLQHPWRKPEVYKVIGDEESHCLSLLCGSYVNNKRATKPKLFYFLLLIFLYCCLILAPHYITSLPTISQLYSLSFEDGRLVGEVHPYAFLCSSVPNGTICCDRHSNRSDVCVMRGDVRTDSKTASVFLYRGNGKIDYAPKPFNDDGDDEVLQHEKIRPYTRKWEPGVMSTVQQLNLFMKKEKPGRSRHCDVQHNVTAVFFSTSGYTGNLYHEFNDGIIPLYLTIQHLNKQVVIVVVDYIVWWYMKYGDVVSELTDYPIIDFSSDNRTHCFPEAIVGLRIHDDLAIDPSFIEGNKTIRDFRNVLDRAYWPRIKGLIEDEERKAQSLAVANSTVAPIAGKVKAKYEQNKPKLVIIARNGSREILNQDSMVKMAVDIGFSVEILVPLKTSELAKIYRVLNSSDVLIGVHGAGLTHFLFMRPGSVFIQIIALGTDWAADKYYGSTAVKFGLKYVGYKIHPKESTLYDSYRKDDPVLVDPYAVNRRGWEVTKEIYLGHQNVGLNLGRFRKQLLRAYYYSMTQKKGFPRPQHTQ